MFCPTCFIFGLWAVGVSPVVSHTRWLARCPEPTRWCRAVYIAPVVWSLFPCLFFFFFSSSLYFCSQITGSLVPRGRSVPPYATKLTVSLRPQFKFARKLRVSVALLKGSSCAVRLTLGVYAVHFKTQTYELSLL